MASAPPLRSDAAEPIRLLIVDDSAVARAVFTKLLAAEPRFVVAGGLPDASSALRFLATNVVDVILLDINMPGTDGISALPDLVAAGRGARVLIVSSQCAAGAAATVQALSLGAADTLAKPALGERIDRFGRALIDRIDHLGTQLPTPAAPPHALGAAITEVSAVAVGASTGGIHALSQLLRALPAGFAAPIVVTQHLPVAFTPYFAAQVAVLAGRPCDVATDRLRLRAGRVIVAPGDAHVTVARTADGAVAVRLSQAPADSGCLPSVDPMFASFATTFGRRGVGIVLSGMGRDGLAGAQAMRDAGATIMVQDQASSVVWGMPGAVAAAGLADAVLAPDAIGRLIGTMRRSA